jgi:hypothetical protein
LKQPRQHRPPGPERVRMRKFAHPQFALLGTSRAATRSQRGTETEGCSEPSLPLSSDRMWGRALIVAFLFLGTPARAEDDDLLPTAVEAFPSSFAQAGAALGLKQRPVLKACLDKKNASEKTICTFMLPDYMTFMVRGDTRASHADEITLICTPGENVSKTASCLIAYAAAIRLCSPQLSKEQRGKLVSALLRGIDVGEQAEVKVQGVKYVLQKLGPLGLWFHAIAAND